ncbi:MAG: DUF378 domain-containing protein [Syntrophales bacterium]|nr:DUF378 domain-containing protein [Syntrophales bacterium]MDD5233477.1 DUF378 domain-containing protein [Syntrophales bacterium]MDD5532321.1 DUF378 domain-containing protein [Syntrophales bacterium]HPL64002.1 DUF378 domain-containing protein [Syntrophales bacterium]
MRRFNTLDWIAIILIIIGGLNWGLIGFFRFDLVAALLGDMTALSRIVYALVGIAAIVALAIIVPKLSRPVPGEKVGVSRP